MSESISPGETGRFHVADGKIFDPSGKQFTARGLNVHDSQMDSADEILARFPQINFIRLAVHHYQSPEAYSQFIDTMTDRGIVVELENHNNGTGNNRGGGEGVAFTGQQLRAESDWYSAVARAYASNPYVWFGTNNEPPQEGLSAWQQATYDSIRATGNDNPIMIQYPGGGVPGLDIHSYGMDPGAYERMWNIIADVHFYGWSSNYSTDQGTVDRTLSDLVRNAQTVRSSDGTLPVIIGEYGLATNGSDRDANHFQVLQTVHRSDEIAGAAAWAWSADAHNTTIDGRGNLSWFGEQLRDWFSFNPPAEAPRSHDVSPDRLSILLSGDGYRGGPQFIAKVGGETLTPEPVTVSAAHGTDSQRFEFTGDWGDGRQDLEISFVNDFYHGTQETDRNLYVEEVSYNGRVVASQEHAMLSTDSAFFSLS